MGAAVSKYRGERITSKIRKDISENIKWLEGISCEQRERLKNYLLNLDKSNRSDVDSDRRSNVHRGVTEIVERIFMSLKERDPRFTGRLVPMGSSNNGTKLGDTDEFDFVYELDLNALLKGKGTCERVDGCLIVLAVDSDADFELVEYLSGPDQLVLKKEKVNYLFRETLSKVLSELELPPGWQHGGFYSPRFSFIREKGPSFVLQFDYLNTSDQVPLSLSVDFVPMLRIPFSADAHISDLNYFLKREAEIEHCWVSINIDPNDIFYGHAEELFLKQYLSESTPKKLMRICKALRIVLQMHLTAYPKKYHVYGLLSAMESLESGRETILCSQRSYGYTQINSSKRKNDYVTCSDLGERGADDFMVKSYWIKQTVLMMMSEDESHGRAWTDDDLPELVLKVYRRIILCKYVNRADHTTDLAQQKIYVPLEDLQVTILEESPQTVKRITGKKNLPKLELDKIFYGDFSNISLGSRLAGIGQLFRSVCEGKRTAELLLYFDIFTNFDELVSKKKIDKMTHLIKKTDSSRDTETDHIEG